MPRKRRAEDQPSLPPAVPAEGAWLETALAASQAADAAAWAALVACPVVEVHTSGAAPGVAGAEAGAAAMVQGYAAKGRRTPAPRPAARLVLRVSLAPGGPDPVVHAALAGLALGQGVLLRLAAGGWSSAQVVVWTNQQAAAQARAPGDWGEVVARQQQLLRWAVPGGVRVAWLPTGEAVGAAEAGALAAAFGSDPAALARYQALHGPRAAPAPAPPAPQPPLATDYTLVLGDAPPLGALAGTPVYRLWTRDGRSRQGYGPAGSATPDPAAGAWATLAVALDDLLGRIARRRQDPARYTLTIYCSHEAVVAALRALTPAAPASRRQVAAGLARFDAAQVHWQPAPLLAAWLASETSDQ